MKDAATFILQNSTYGKMKADTMISITRSDWNSDFRLFVGRTRNKKPFVKREQNSNVVFRFTKGLYSSCKSKKLN